MHRRLQFLQLGKAGKLPVQQQPVLQNAVAEPARQRRFAAIHAAQQLLERAVRPRAGFPADQQRAQRGIPAGHTHSSIG